MTETGELLGRVVLIFGTADVIHDEVLKVLCQAEVLAPRPNILSAGLPSTGPI